MKKRSADHRCRGLTLFEVVLALSILLVSVAALGQLISTGSRAAVTAQLRTEAVLRCQSKLDEIVAGVEPLQSAADVPFDDQPNQWSWTLNIGDGPVDGLLFLELTVNHVGAGTAGNASFTLERYLRDPQLFLDAADNEIVQDLEE